jgi:hypothetical protein
MSEEKFADLYRVVEPDLIAELRSNDSSASSQRLRSTSTAVGRALEQIGSRYRRSVEDADRRMADVKRQHSDAVLGAIARGFDALNAISLTPSTPRVERTEHPERSFRTPPRGSWMAWAGLIGVAALVALAALAVSGAAAVIAAGAALLALLAAATVKTQGPQPRGRSRTGTLSAVSTPPSISIDARKVSNSVADALLEADAALVQLARTLPAQQRSSGGLADDQTMLVTLQGLLGADMQHDSAEIGLRVREVRSALRRHGVSVVAFDGTNDDLFDFERAYGAEVSDPTTLVPALTSSTGTLMRGRAIRPTRGAPVERVAR